MGSENYTTVNKYGKIVSLPKTEHTKPEVFMTFVLDSIGIHTHTPNEDGLSYVTQFFFDESGYRRKKYDVAILKDSEPKLLIEYDGEPHYTEQFYEDVGVRPERCTAHVVQTGISDAIKTALALKHNVPYLRINSYHLPHLRDLLIAYIEIIVNGTDCLKNANNEIVMINMLEKYGWDFDYVSPSSPTKAEIARIEQMKNK